MPPEVATARALLAAARSVLVGVSERPSWAGVRVVRSREDWRRGSSSAADFDSVDRNDSEEAVASVSGRALSPDSEDEVVVQPVSTAIKTNATGGKAFEGMAVSYPSGCSEHLHVAAVFLNRTYPDMLVS